MSKPYNLKTVRIIGAIPDLVAAGDIDKIQDVMIEAINAMKNDVWDDEVADPLNALRAMPCDQRSELIAGLLPRFDELDMYRYDCLSRLIEMLSDGLDEEFTVAVTEAQLAYAAGFFEYFPMNWPIEWAAAIQAGGGGFTPEMIALVRRHQHIPYIKQGYKKLFIDFAEPILNAGEAWTDRLMADLPGLGEDWRKLVTHAKTANGTKPSATWDRKATAMLAEIGHPQATKQLTQWLELMPRRRTAELGLSRDYDSVPYDPFNVVAARGLVWAASLLPADPALAWAIAALVVPATVKVKTGQVRSVRLAGAAVFGLERIPGDDAARELESLEDKVSHGAVLNQIRGARAVHR